jgi:hypothetical protein
MASAGCNTSSATSSAQPAQSEKREVSKTFAFGGRQQFGNLVGARNIVIDKQPSRSLLGKTAQSGLRGLFEIGLVGCDGAEFNREGGQRSQ